MEKHQNYNIFRQKHRHKPSSPPIRQCLLRYDTRGTRKEKKKYWPSPKVKTSVHQRTPLRKSKENPQNERKLLEIVCLLREWYPEYGYIERYGINIWKDRYGKNPYNSIITHLKNGQRI